MPRVPIRPIHGRRPRVRFLSLTRATVCRAHVLLLACTVHRNGKRTFHRETALHAAQLAKMTALPPAIVVGAQVNGLGVVRSLAQASLPVITLDTSLAQPAMWSRSSQRV